MDLKIAARMIAVLALGAAMTAAVMAWRGDGTEDAPSHHLRHPGGEPERSELTRCRNLGMAAARNAVCKKAWAEHRRRFLETRVPERPATPKAERFGTESDAPPITIDPPISLPVSP